MNIPGESIPTTPAVALTASNQEVPIPPEVPAGQRRLLSLFLAMVQIDSPSGHEQLMQAYLKAWCAKRGLPVVQDSGGNLLVDIPAQNDTSGHRLALSAHMDVVPPCLGISPQLQPVTNRQGQADWDITSDGTTVLGADAKAGIAIILEALDQAREQQLPHPAIRLLWTTREEINLLGAKDLADDALADVTFALTLDHTGEPGTIVYEAPTLYQLEIDCHGKPSHAGLAPEAGVSAILFASRVVTRLADEGHLHRINPDTTSCISLIHGGRAINVVPDHVHMTGELRGHDDAVLAHEKSAFAQALATEKQALPGSNFAFEAQDIFHHFCADTTLPVCQCLEFAAQQVGLEPQWIRTNGGSDQNVFFKRGLPGLVLTACYRAPHTQDEAVCLGDMDACVQWLKAILGQLASTAAWL
jgi:tripeptide aminopeptidase